MINKSEVYSLLEHNACGGSDSQTDKSFHTTSPDYSFLSKSKSKNYQLKSSGIAKSKIITFQSKENNPFFADKFNLNQYSIERNTQDLSNSLSSTSTKFHCNKYQKKQPIKATFFNQPLKQSQLKIKAQSPLFSKSNNNKHSNIERDEYFAQIQVKKKESDSTKQLNHSQSIVDTKSLNAPAEQILKQTKSQPKQQGQGSRAKASPKNQQLKISNLLSYPKQSKFRMCKGSKQSSNVQSPSNLQDLTNLSISRNNSKKTNVLTLRHHPKVKEEKENQPIKINQSIHNSDKNTVTQTSLTKTVQSKATLGKQQCGRNDNIESKKFRSLSKFSNTTQASNSSKNSSLKSNNNHYQNNQKTQAQQQYKIISSEFTKKLQEDKQQKEFKDQFKREKKQQMAKTLAKLRESSKERVSTYLTKGQQNFKKFEIKS